MKQILLIFIFGLFVNLGFAQDRCFGCDYQDSVHNPYGANLFASADLQLAIYPNPATDYFKLKESSGVKEVKMFNLVGRQVKDFDSVTKDQAFQVSDLPNGMYLVQLVNFRNEIITTHRLNKR